TRDATITEGGSCRCLLEMRMAFKERANFIDPAIGKHFLCSAPNSITHLFARKVNEEFQGFPSVSNITNKVGTFLSRLKINFESANDAIRILRRDRCSGIGIDALKKSIKMMWNDLLLFFGRLTGSDHQIAIHLPRIRIEDFCGKSICYC